jgi:hypothetical protein
MFGATVQSAHKYKVAPWQAEGIYNDVFASMNKRLADMDAAGAREVETMWNTLRGKWGADFDGKKAGAERAASALAERYGLKAPDMKKLQDVIGNAPAVTQMFAELGEIFGEDKLRGQGSPSGSANTPAAARAQRKALEADPEWMKIFNDNRHDQHKDYVAKRQRLLEIEAAGEKAA